MSAKIPHRIYPPLKPLMAILFAALLGTGVYLVDSIWFGGAASSGTGAQAGPLPGQSVAITLESDQEILARLEKEIVPHQPIEFRDPAAMADFSSALWDLTSGRRRDPVRILHYGDSILTSDHLTGQVRTILQKKFGDGGHGFVLLGKPWSWYWHQGVMHGAWGKWRARPLTSDPVEDGLYGLGGVAFQAELGSRGTAAFVGTTKDGDIGRTVARFELSYLEQPGGGSFSVKINGVKRETVLTKADSKRVAHRIITVPSGPARLQIEFNNDGLLRVFGATLETGDPGVVLDSLAINGARASVLARFNMAHWISEINHRGPSLVILMFGANEGANKTLNVPEYQKQLDALLSTLVPGMKGASCLVMGPLDQASADATGALKSKRMPIRLAETQREVAFRHGCAFFDTRQAMGGEGSMGTWYRTGLAAGDMIHPTEAGSKRLGTWFAEALVHAYQQYGKQKRPD